MQNIQGANDLFQAKKYKIALKQYTALLSKDDSNNAVLYQRIAQCQFALNKFNKAIEASKQALKYQPKLILPHTVLAYIYGRTKGLEEGYEEAKNAYQLDPNSWEALECYGAFLRAMERYDEAFFILQKSLEINPKSSIAMFNLGLMYRQKKDYKKYTDLLKTVFFLEPTIKNGFRLASAFSARYTILFAIFVLIALALSLALKIVFLLFISSIPLLIPIFTETYWHIKHHHWGSAISHVIFILMLVSVLFLMYKWISMK
jgi:tetratricopeptide (TPR) repeat protein